MNIPRTRRYPYRPIEQPDRRGWATPGPQVTLTYTPKDPT